MRSGGGTGCRPRWCQMGRAMRRGCTAALFILLSGQSILAAAETQLRGVEARQFSIEEEPAPQLGFRPPPATYPLSPVDQKASRGARHGFVNTTLGNLVFRVPALRLP